MHQYLRVRGKLSDDTNPMGHSLAQLSPALKTGLFTNKEPSRGENQIQTGGLCALLCPQSPRAAPGLLASPGHPVLTQGQQAMTQFLIYRSW